MKVQSFRIPAFANMHVHLRETFDERCPELLRQHARHSDLIMAMPNTVQPLASAERIRTYREGLDKAWDGPTDDWIKLAWFFSKDHARDEVEAMASLPGVIAAKMYPGGMTSQSHGGIDPALIVNWKDGNKDFDDALGMLSELGVVLCIHAEAPLELTHTRTYHSGLEGTESIWIAFLKDVTARFGNLRVVVEHVTTAAMIEWVSSNADRQRVAATVTPQHLEWHLGHLFEGGLRPMRYCKPVYKMPRDNYALWKAVAHSPNVFLGSDCAPWARARKLEPCGCAGVYSTPILPELLGRLFEKADWLTRLADFSSGRARTFYRIEGGLSRSKLARNRRIYSSEIEYRRLDWTYQSSHPQYETAWEREQFGWKTTREVSLAANGDELTTLENAP